ncbi:hypothetical protein [Streptomyces malaysiensis]|uniref:hypothetical protein n=1 Tax=Streptomyces malaysiensis TaxID=92644 RepID=UPI00340C115B
MQPATIHNHVYYRCGFNAQEQALYPDLTHPRTVYLREDIVCKALDQWIARAFASDRLTATIEALAHASAAASTAETRTPEQTQARQAIKNCERRLARYQAALEAGADPTVVTQWINDAQRDKETALRRPRHHHQLRTHNEDRDRKVEALIAVSPSVCVRGGT